jgi:hypothetical protein
MQSFWAILLPLQCPWFRYESQAWDWLHAADTHPDIYLCWVSSYFLYSAPVSAQETFCGFCFDSQQRVGMLVFGDFFLYILNYTYYKACVFVFMSIYLFSGVKVLESLHSSQTHMEIFVKYICLYTLSFILAPFLNIRKHENLHGHYIKSYSASTKYQKQLAKETAIPFPVVYIQKKGTVSQISANSLQYYSQ